MSHYIQNLRRAITHALAGIPMAQPSQVAGYWANRQFWIDEFKHLLDVIDAFDGRLTRMKEAETAYTRNHGGPHNLDEFGDPKQKVRDSTNSSSRRFAASEARSALKTLADRSLDLSIASNLEYDTFVGELRVASREQASN